MKPQNLTAKYQAIKSDTSYTVTYRGKTKEFQFLGSSLDAWKDAERWMGKLDAEVEVLYNEFIRLKKAIFGDAIFVVVEETDQQKRYDQLFQYFYPTFRTKQYVSPL